MATTKRYLSGTRVFVLVNDSDEWSRCGSYLRIVLFYTFIHRTAVVRRAMMVVGNKYELISNNSKNIVITNNNHAIIYSKTA